MKKNYFILLFSLFCGTIVVSAQPTTTQEPNLPVGSTSYPLYTDEISLFGEVSNKNGADLTEITIDRKNVLQVTLPTTTSYEGQIEIPIEGAITTSMISQYSKFQFDVWVSSALTSNVASIRFQNGTTSISGANTNIGSSNTSAGVWKTIEIDTDKFNNLQVDRLVFLNHLATNDGSTVFYVDNFLLYEPPVVVDPAPTTFLEPTHSDIFSIFSDNTDGNKIGSTSASGIFSVTPYTAPGGKTAYKVKRSTGGGTYNYFRFNITDTDYQETISDLLKDYNKIHFDVWSSETLDNGYLRVDLYEGATINASVITPKAVSANNWESFDIDLSRYSESSDKVMKGIQFLNRPSTNTEAVIYIDNIYLYYETPAPDPIPTLQNPVTIWNGETTSGTWVGGTETTVNGNTYREITLSTPTNYTLNSTRDLENRNMLYVDVFVKDVLPGLTISLSDGTNSRSKTITTPLSQHSWNTLNIPVDEFTGVDTSNIKSVSFSGTGTIGVDNIIFYYTDNPYPVARVYIGDIQQAGDYYTLKAAVDAANAMSGDVDIRIIRSSNEATSIVIRKKDEGVLTIYPSSEVEPGIKTITHTMATATEKDNLSLFLFETGAENVVINGKLDKTGESKSLILQGTYLQPSGAPFNSTIYLTAVKKVTIADCKFKGQSADNRPNSVIRGAGEDVKIKDNYFEDCLPLGNVKAGDVTSMSVITVGPKTSTVKNFEISGNHFYETTAEGINFTGSAIVRSFIKAVHSSINSDTPLRILNNKIGGTGADLSGTMRIGYGDGSVQGSLWAIYVNSSHANGSINVDNTTAYALIQGNEIGNIDMYNREVGIWNTLADESTKFEEDMFGGITGIYTYDGLALVKDNIVHDIKITSKPHATIEIQRHLFVGIRNGISGGQCRVIIEGNELYNFAVDYTEDASKSAIITGIFTQIMNTSAGTKVAATIRGNKVIMGHTGTHGMHTFADIRGISARIGNISVDAANTARIDVYNNISVFNEFKLTGTSIRSVSAFDLMNFASTDNGAINCYNNIALIQAKASDSYAGITTPILGITSNNNNYDGVINIFHNTVYLNNDASLRPVTSAALGYEAPRLSTNLDSPVGKLNIWNNNFVNTVAGTNAAVYYNLSIYDPKAVSFDYNNYYASEEGCMMLGSSNFTGYNSNKIATFDNWKFSNLLGYLDKTTEHDHHSRFLYPCFGSKTTPIALPVITISNIESLKTELIPARFLGGRETDVTNLTTMEVSIDASNVATVTSTAMIPETNKDFADVTARRRYLPTIGALNTSFTNYWNGSAFTDITPASGNTNPWERDIVFAEGLTAATPALSLTTDMSVHDIYNDTPRQLSINEYTLTVGGYIEMKGNGKIVASSADATVIYAGKDGYTTSVQGSNIGIAGKNGAAAQHIFENTYEYNQINNLVLNNNSEYFVLLHGARSWPLGGDEPQDVTLDISNDFRVINMNDTEIRYPDESISEKKHIGGLMCTWYNTSISFTGLSGGTPDLSEVAAWNGTNDDTKSYYRPYPGQRIPRHGIYNNELYILTCDGEDVVTYHDYLYINKELNIEYGSFEIAADKYVKVDGQVTNAAGTSGLIIKSRETDVTETTEKLNPYLFPVLPRPNATFIYNAANNDNNIPATVEMYSPAELSPSEWISAGGSNYEYRWQYFGVPVTSQVASVSGSTIYKYNPEGNNNLAGHQGGSPYWTTIPTGNFEPFSGYCIYNSAKKVYEWKGNLINDDFDKNLSYLISPITEAQIEKTWKDFTRADGKYLLANPYTAAIDIKQMDLGSDLDQTIYLYNTGSNADFNNTENTAGAPGTTLSVPKALAGEEYQGIKLPQYIPSMQAFTIAVQSESATDTNISFKYDAVNGTISKNDAVQRSAAYKSETTSLRIDLKQDGYSDWVLLLTHPDCRKGFDNGWDGRTTPDSSRPLSIFTIEEEDGIEQDKSYYQISTMDNLNETYLGILVGNMQSAEKTNTPENDYIEYELVFNHEAGSELYLQDLYLNTIVDVSAPGATYTFIEPGTGEVQKRFRLISRTNSGTTGTEDSPRAELLTVYSYDKNIMINNKGDAGTVSVYDITGKCIITQDLPAKSPLCLQTNAESGVYLIRAISGTQIINQSIILK